MGEGTYWTAINIHNVTRGARQGAKRVALEYRNPPPWQEASGVAPPVQPHEVMTVVPNRVLVIDCVDIYRMTDVTNPEDLPFHKGMVHIGLRAS